MSVRLEFYGKEPNIGWRIRYRARGPVVAESAQHWKDLATARRVTGNLIKLLMRDEFTVYDFTGPAKPNHGGVKRERSQTHKSAPKQQ